MFWLDAENCQPAIAGWSATKETSLILPTPPDAARKTQMGSTDDWTITDVEQAFGHAVKKKYVVNQISTLPSLFSYIFKKI